MGVVEHGSRFRGKKGVLFRWVFLFFFFFFFFFCGFVGLAFVLLSFWPLSGGDLALCVWLFKWWILTVDA